MFTELLWELSEIDSTKKIYIFFKKMKIQVNKIN